MSSVWWDRIGGDAGPVEPIPDESDSRMNRATSAIVLGGLVAGGCDLVYTVAFCGVQGVAPTHILQSIAGGVLGPNSHQGGWASAILGIALHFVIALTAATIYDLASRKITILLSRAPLCGALSGAVIYFFMRRVVLPLSAAPPFKSTALSSWTDFAVHVFLIGLPIALIVRHYSLPPFQQPQVDRQCTP